MISEKSESRSTSLEDALSYFSNPDLSKFDNHEDGDLIKEFYANLLNAYLSVSSDGRNKGDRHFISKILQEELLKIIKKLSDKTNFVVSEKNIVNESMKDFIKRKNIDLYVDGGSKHRVAIEIKTTLEFNPLGAAYLEALVTSDNFDKFFVVSLWIKTDKEYQKMRELIKNTELGHKITDLVVFNPKLPGFEEGVNNLFKAIREASRNV